MALEFLRIVGFQFYKMSGLQLRIQLVRILVLAGYVGSPSNLSSAFTVSSIESDPIYMSVWIRTLDTHWSFFGRRQSELDSPQFSADPV